MLINSARGFAELGLEEFVAGFHRDRLLVVPASSLALTHLGRPPPDHSTDPHRRGAERDGQEGELAVEFLNVESEFAAMSVAVRWVGSGGR